MNKTSDVSKPTPLQAIRKKCLWCANDSNEEIRHCPVLDCALWPYRFGKGPDVASQENNQQALPTSLKSIRAKCLECSSFSPDEVRNCAIKICALWPYRMGTNPNRKGVGGNPAFKLQKPNSRG